MGAPVGWALGGALLGALFGNSQNNSQSSSTQSYTPIQFQQNSPIATMPQAPEAPSAEDGSKTEAMLTAEEEERKKRAAEAEANRTNYTGGLGLTSAANINRKTLLG